MKRFLRISVLFLAVITLVGTRIEFTKPISADSIYTGDRITALSDQSSGGLGSITPGYFTFDAESDTGHTSGAILIYLTWANPSSSPISMLNPADFYELDYSSSINIDIDDDYDTETPKVEYTFTTEVYRMNEAFYDGSPSFQLSGQAEYTYAAAIGIYGPQSITPVSETSDLGTSFSIAEDSSDDMAFPLGFLTAIADFDEPNYISYTSTEFGTYGIENDMGYFGSNIAYFSEIFAEESTDSNSSAGIEFFDSDDQPVDANYIGYEYNIVLRPEPTDFGINISDGPTVTEDDVFIAGTAVVPNDYITEVYYKIVDGPWDYIFQDTPDGECMDCTSSYEFELNLEDLTDGDYTIEFYVTDNNFGDPVESAATVVNFSIENGGGGGDDPAFPYVTVDAGPTVNGRSVTLSGHSTSEGGAFYVNQIYYYINFGGLTYMPAADGNYDEATEEFELQLDDLPSGNYTLEFYTSQTDGNTTVNSEGGGNGNGPVVVNFEIEDVGVVALDEPTIEGNDATITGSVTARNGSYNINGIFYKVNGGSTQSIATPDDGTYDEQNEDFTLNLNDLETGDYDIEIFATEIFGVDEGTIPSEFAEFSIVAFDPLITINTGPTSNTSSYIYVEGNVSDANGDIVDSVYYELDGGESVAATPVDGAFDSADEDFIIGPLGPYQNDTEFDFVITATNELDEIDTETYTDLIIQNTIDPAECELSNHQTPTNDTTPTYTISCSSTDKVVKMEYRIQYSNNLPFMDWTEIISDQLTVGEYGDESVTAVFTHPDPLNDGVLSMRVNAYTESGRFHTKFLNETFNHDYDPGTPMDIIVIEATDNSVPTLKINPILPNPITSTSPFISGTCQDTNAFDTNSNIALLQYRVDGGSWTNIPLKNAPLDSTVEYFNFQLEDMDIGEHTVEIRCSDAAGHSTEDDDTNGLLEYEIIPQPDVEPERVEITEDFTTHDLNSINETTAIWGNGYIRLKEKITFEREILDSTNYRNRYGTTFSAGYPLNGYGNDLWYAKDKSLVRYNTQTEESEVFEDLFPSDEPAVNISGFEYFELGGSEYVIYSSGTVYGVWILDVSTGNVTMVEETGFGGTSYGPRGPVRDPRNPNGGFYFHNNATNTDEDSNFFYLDLNGTPLNMADDTVTWYSSAPGFDTSNISQVTLDEDNNVLYLAAYEEGLIRIDDNGTPSNTADDTRTLFDESDNQILDIITSIRRVPGSSDLFITGYEGSGIELVFVDTNNTPNNPADDTFTRIADRFDLHREFVDFFTFIEGPQYIGGQMFMQTRSGKIIYYNTNGTYDDSADDTSILLNTNLGKFPEYISGMHIDDYNTIYANFHHSGMARIDLNRSWEDTGDAVTISIPPEVRLFVNNINLEDVILGPLVEDEDGSTQNNNSGIGIEYFISLDDGDTYTEVTPGQLNYILEQEDYRLKLKITLTKIGLNSQTPVIEGFSLAYAAYTAPPELPDVDSIEISTPLTSFEENQNFTITVRAYDELGFLMQSLNETINLQLQHFDTSENASVLTPVTLNMVNGVATTTVAQISEVGSYKIVASMDSFTDESVELTVTEATEENPGDPDPTPGVTPTLNFGTDKTSITKGESATLFWNSTNLQSLNLSGVGSVLLNGSLVVNPEVTTTYILTGTDADGDTISAGLTITVVEQVSSAPVSFPQTGVGSEGETEALEIVVPSDYIEVPEGEKVRIEWEVKGNPETVFIDYQNTNVTNSGFFEFYPGSDTSITITARKGNQIVSKTITIKIISPLNATSILLPALVGALGLAATSFVSGGFFHYISIFVGFVILKRKKYWGVVYNASRMNKISFATVRVYKRIGSQKVFVTQTITDLEGRYGIPLNETGQYLVEFIHDGYRTEIRDLTIQRDSDIVLDVGMFEVDKQSLALFTKFRIFMKEQAPGIMQFLRLVLLTLMVIGAYITIQVISVSPTVYNYIVLMLYLVTIFFQLVVILRPMFDTKKGRVLEAQTKKPVKGAILRILNTGQKATNGVETISMTNESGVLKMRIKPGMYEYHLSRSGFEPVQGKIKIDNSGKIVDTIYMNRISTSNSEPQKFGQL